MPRQIETKITQWVRFQHSEELADEQVQLLLPNRKLNAVVVVSVRVSRRRFMCCSCSSASLLIAIVLLSESH